MYRYCQKMDTYSSHFRAFLSFRIFQNMESIKDADAQIAYRYKGNKDSITYILL
jgi:hypothetical protein